MLGFSSTVLKAFETFLSSPPEPFALTLHLAEELKPLGVVFKSYIDFEHDLRELGPMIHAELPIYAIIRRDDALVLVTFAPWRAPTAGFFIHNRRRLARWLGEDRFSLFMICREPVEVIDSRVWEERTKLCEKYESQGRSTEDIKDIGYLSTKCRLCDRRMQSEISQEGLDAFSILGRPGAVVQFVSKLPWVSLE